MEDALLDAQREHGRGARPAPACRRRWLRLLLRGAITVAAGYLCIGELLPLPLTKTFVAFAGLPKWEVQQLVLLAGLCGLAAAQHAATFASSPGAERVSELRVTRRVSAEVLLAVANVAPLVASVLTALWWTKSDNCSTATACGWMQIATDAIGIMSARCARLDLALCLLPSAKESLWLLLGQHDYSSAMPLHRLAGYWCAVQSGLHSVAYLLFYVIVQDGGLPGVWVNCFPVPLATHLNSLGLVNGMGVLAFAVGIPLALMALPQLRRQRYHMFQRLHLLLALLFVGCCALHDLQIVLFALPGLVSWYLCSTAGGSCGCERSAVKPRLIATARLLPGTKNWVELSITGQLGTWFAGGAGGRGHWVSLRAPTKVGREWHPLSVADWSHADARAVEPETTALSVVVTTQHGDWSQKLGQQFVAGSPGGEEGASVSAQFEVDLMGPFCTGGGWSLYGGAGESSGDMLLLLAGGTGITGWLPGLQVHAANTSAGKP